jgi:hypothetical protein
MSLRKLYASKRVDSLQMELWLSSMCIVYNYDMQHTAGRSSNRGLTNRSWRHLMTLSTVDWWLRSHEKDHVVLHRTQTDLELGTGGVGCGSGNYPIDLSDGRVLTLAQEVFYTLTTTSIWLLLFARNWTGYATLFQKLDTDILGASHTIRTLLTLKSAIGHWKLNCRYKTYYDYPMNL